MAVVMRETGRTTTCMGMEYTLGKTEGNMMVNISKTESMDSEFILGQMGDNMKVNGRMAVSMVKGTTGSMQALNHVVGSGLKGRENVGSMSNENRFEIDVSGSRMLL